jgi:hypothetical protein
MMTRAIPDWSLLLLSLPLLQWGKDHQRRLPPLKDPGEAAESCRRARENSPSFLAPFGSQNLAWSIRASRRVGIDWGMV